MRPEFLTESHRKLRLHDLEPAVATMHADVLAGLRSSPKFLPSQYLYDDRGARLFELICEQPEYYITRTEIAILESNMDSIAGRVGPHALLIEPGSGEGTKSALLLNGLFKPAGYVPIDISRAQLVSVASSIADRFPGIEVAPVCADLTDDPEVPTLSQPVRRRVAFFPGSTIGNLVPEDALDDLRHLRTLCGDERGFDPAGFSGHRSNVGSEARTNGKGSGEGSPSPAGEPRAACPQQAEAKRGGPGAEPPGGGGLGEETHNLLKAPSAAHATAWSASVGVRYPRAE